MVSGKLYLMAIMKINIGLDTKSMTHGSMGTTGGGVTPDNKLEK